MQGYTTLFLKQSRSNVVPMHAVKAYREVEALLHILLALSLDGGEWSSSRLGCLTLEEMFFLLRAAALRLIVRSELDVPTFAIRRLHACHQARAPSGGKWNCGREMSGNFA
jgi:hypothetical protein